MPSKASTLPSTGRWVMNIRYYVTDAVPHFTPINLFKFKSYYSGKVIE